MEDEIEKFSCTLNIDSSTEENSVLENENISEQNQSEEDSLNKPSNSTSPIQNQSIDTSGLFSQQDQLANILSQFMTSAMDSIFSKQLEILTENLVPGKENDNSAINSQIVDTISLDGDTNASSSSPLIPKLTINQNSNTAMERYNNRLINLQMYYNTHKLKEIETDGFFETNQYIFEYIKKHSIKLETFLEKYMKPFENSVKVFEEWQQIKEFLTKGHCNDEFTKMLFSLSNEQEAMLNGIKNLMDIVTVHRIKNERSAEEISKVFLILILDALSDFNVIMDGDPTINLQIYLSPIKDKQFDHDIIYRFSHKKNNEPFFSDSVLPNETSEQIKCIHGDINTNPLHFLFYSVKLKNPYWMIMLKFFLAFSTLLGVFLDILLVIKFLRSGQIYFAFLTATILIIAGIGITVLERYVLKVHQQDAEFMGVATKNAIILGVLSFFQLSLFLRSMKIVMVSLKRKRQPELDTLLDIILHNRPEILQDNLKFLKYVETYLEALPQTILQIFIVLTTQQWSYLQLFSIAKAVINIHISALTFMASSKSYNDTNIWKNPKYILLDISYNGILITSYCVLFYQLQAKVVLGILTCLFIFSIGSKINTTDAKSLIFFGRPITKINYAKFFNKMSLVENVIYISIILIKFVYFEVEENQFFNGILVYYCISFLLWTVLILINDFIYLYNIMYLPLFIRDSWSILAEHRHEY